jgi:hypothetical protein
MSMVVAPEVLADPIGVVVGLVSQHDPLLNEAVIAEVVLGVAGGRAKRRRLAQALLDKPEVLREGRSPAPRAVADLLIAVRKAGATGISLPVCAECGKQLRTVQRRGEHWYCGVCGPKREPCAACGQLRRVRCRDRQGQPRCAQCPPGDGHDPTDLIVRLVTDTDPTLPPDRVAAAVASAAPRSGQCQRLAWALQDRPDLLTGAGADTPDPSVLRLIDRLCDAGAQTIIHPACPRCDRVIHLHRPIDGQWLCRNCTAKSRAQRCSRCGAIREAATRDQHGRPLCPSCLITDPANLEVCRDCRRCLPVTVRTPTGPLCQNCRPVPTMTCAICGRHAPCVISKTTGQPWCFGCQQRRGRCTRCQTIGPLYGGTRAQPLCGPCTRPDPEFWRPCPTCGIAQVQRPGPCTRCGLHQRLRELLSDDTGQIRAELRALHLNLLDAEHPDTVLGWLNKKTATQVLAQLAAGTRPMTHTALDELPDTKPLRHLRSVLVATGALPPRDEQLARLERWINSTINDRDDPDERQLLRRYALWHLMRRLRRRTTDTETTDSQTVGVRRHLSAAVVLLDWLRAQDLTLHTARQNDLESWLASDATHRREAGHFVRWARKQKLTTLDFAAERWGGPSSVIDGETRWNQARWLLHDRTVKPEDRVAGLLVLLYAQWPATISRLTTDHVLTDDTQVRLRLGHEPVVLPEPLATLVLALVATRHGHATLGDQGTSPWLFPGGRPNRPISHTRLTERLRQLGIRSGQGRSTALFQLTTELPAALLARMLGIHISVAVAWQRASAGDWTAYAAEISRRTHP